MSVCALAPPAECGLDGFCEQLGDAKDVGGGLFERLGEGLVHRGVFELLRQVLTAAQVDDFLAAFGQGHGVVDGASRGAVVFRDAVVWWGRTRRGRLASIDSLIENVPYAVLLCFYGRHGLTIAYLDKRRLQIKPSGLLGGRASYSAKRSIGVLLIILFM